MIDIRDHRVAASNGKKQHGEALKAQMAEDKQRHDYRELDLVDKEKVTSSGIMN
jgi:hypothetical protein